MLAGYDNGDVKMFDLRMNKVGGGAGWTRSTRPDMSAS